MRGFWDGAGVGGALGIVGGPELALEEGGEKEEEPSRVMSFIKIRRRKPCQGGPPTQEAGRVVREEGGSWVTGEGAARWERRQPGGEVQLPASQDARPPGRETEQGCSVGPAPSCRPFGNGFDKTRMPRG